jgi:flagellar basal body-associated protein FliL
MAAPKPVPVPQIAPPPLPAPKRSFWPVIAGILGSIVLGGGAFVAGAVFFGNGLPGITPPGASEEQADAGAAPSETAAPEGEDSKKESPEKSAEEKPKKAAGETAGSDVEAVRGESTDSTKGLGFAAPSEENMVSLGTFTVNLRGAGGGRVLRMSIYLQAKGGQADALSAAQAQLRDATLTLASDYTYDEIEGIEGKTRLREELLVRMNAVLGDSMIERVYFTEFVVQ